MVQEPLPGSEADQVDSWRAARGGRPWRFDSSMSTHSPTVPSRGTPPECVSWWRLQAQTGCSTRPRRSNLSETAFVHRRADGDFDLRWFTPVAEVELCGHATLATAHSLWELGELDAAQTAQFHTKSGLLTAARRGEWIELDFPASPTEPVAPPAGLLEALGLRATFVGKTRFDFLVEVESEASVRSAAPDFDALRRPRRSRRDHHRPQ